MIYNSFIAINTAPQSLDVTQALLPLSALTKTHQKWYLFLIVLRPVNEYKIADKIIEANRELFGEDYDPKAEPVARPATDEVGARPAICLFASIDLGPAEDGKRRVSFRRLLEDFEPDFITDNEDEDDDVDDPTHDYSVSESEAESEEQVASVETDSAAVAATVERDKMNMMLDSPNRRRSNPPPSTIGNNNNNDKLETKIVESKPTIATIAPNSPVSGDTVGTPEIDEICEVIEEFGLANPNDLLSPTISTVALTIGRDKDNGGHAMTTDDNCDDCLSQSSDSSQSGDIRCQHDPEIQRSIATAVGGCSSPVQPNGVVRARTTLSQSDTQQPPKSSRQKQNNQPMNSQSQHSSTQSKTSSSSNHHISQTNRNVDHSNFMKIQLNFKPCCELKNADAARRLPSYCGYVSQYGLSKEQLDQRAARRERHHIRLERRVEIRAVEESNKSRVNEEAFARWLAVKMRTGGNGSGTRNMYDYVPRKKFHDETKVTRVGKKM